MTHKYATRTISTGSDSILRSARDRAFYATCVGRMIVPQFAT